MIIQIIEQFHDYEKQIYFVETDKMNPENPLDKMVLKACKKKAFNQEVYVNCRELADQGADKGFWEEPGLDPKSALKKKDEKNARPEKVIHLTLYFDC